VPDVETFAAHHGYELAASCTVSDSARKNGGGAEFKKILQKALDDAHAGNLSVLVVWALDRIVREGAEDALRIFRQFRQCGCVVVPVRESWLNSYALPHTSDGRRWPARDLSPSLPLMVRRRNLRIRLLHPAA
jgi:Resolvase, N terminal domain